MKILVLGPSNMVHLRRFVPALSGRGLDVHVISMKPDLIGGATCERFAVPRFGARYPHRWRRRWHEMVRNWFRAFDVVNVHFLSDWGISQELIGNGCLVVKAYGSDVDHPPGTPAVSEDLLAARKRLVQCATMTVTSGIAFRDKVVEFAGIDAAKVVAIPDGIDVNLFSRNRGQGCDEAFIVDGPVVGFFKGFDPVYDPMTMVEATAYVLRRCPEVRFDFVGDGALRGDCRARCEALGINGSIRWIDRQPHNSMPQLMSGWALAAISSAKESFCVAALEAAAMGIPVVATDVGGLRQTVANGETGLLVPPGSPQALGEGLLTLLDDAERRCTMGRAGRQRVVEEFEWETSIDQWVNLFESLRRQPVSQNVFKMPLSEPRA